MRPLPLVLSLAILAACGGNTPEPVAPPTPPSAPNAEANVAVSVWSKDLTKDQQIAFMKKNVVGPMGDVFKANQPAKYADFSCKTCHGPDAKDPKEYLPKLTFKDGKMTAFAEKPEVAKFMATAVTPAMAHAMGAQPFDPQTHQGFGCNGCHTVDMK
jgi:mono/diheme cytochrome c family protein